MPLKPVQLDSWRPDSGFSISNGAGIYGGIVGGEGMVEITNLVPTGGGFSGIGPRMAFSGAPTSIVGTPNAVRYHPETSQIFQGTTGAGTDSRIYERIYPFPNTWTDRFAAGTANADWFFLPFGTSMLTVGGTGVRMMVSTAAVPNFANVTSNVSPKYMCRFGNRVFIANLSWNIAGITTVATSGTETDHIFASNYNDAGTFGDSTSSPGLGAAIFLLRDEFGPITGIAATETYILVTKPGALIVGRRSTSYDIDWSYLGARFGCVQPRSIVVDGESIYLWSNSGPIVVRDGTEVEQIATGNFQFTLEHRNNFGGTSPVFLGYGSAAKVCGALDPDSGLIEWSYTPGTDLGSGAWGTSTSLDRSVVYNPVTKQASSLNLTSAQEVGSALGATSYKATCSITLKAGFPIDGQTPGPLTRILRVRGANGAIDYLSMPFNFSNPADIFANPVIRTHWFGSDTGMNFRIQGINFPFAKIADFGLISVVIKGINDRNAGTVYTEGPFIYVDPQGHLDTSASSEFQVISLEITLGNRGTLASTAAWSVRNFRLFEVNVLETTYQGRK
jgi:hypothetical protein